jgi:aspartate aminotransferase-like enzyme
MFKYRLLTPGPTPVPEDTLLELARPVPHHRTPEARQILAEVVSGLQYVFQTRNDVLPLTCSGTGAMEAALVHAAPRGAKAICLVAGKFGERWHKLWQAFGVESVAVTVPPGEVVTPEQLEQALRAHPDAVAVCAVHSETSTGVKHDLAALGALVARTEAVFIVDAVSSAGALELRMDDWHIDFLATGSQKALMLPPGLAFVAVSEKGWRAVNRHQPPVFYFDLRKAREKIRENDTPFTPAHTLLRALRKSLQRIPRGRDREYLAATSPRCSGLPCRGASVGTGTVRAGTSRGADCRQSPSSGGRTGIVAAIGKRVRRQAGRGTGPAQGQNLPHRSHGIHRLF